MLDGYLNILKRKERVKFSSTITRLKMIGP